ncbi:hypothetical protein GCM10023235_78090 [Kitasatospora terrestris]|uniref:Secreted protein n=1 Tax=Kitasatospora terrestris TaxID=258051 RepID=A0ABP9ERB4_9ACTN
MWRGPAEGGFGRAAASLVCPVPALSCGGGIRWCPFSMNLLAFRHRRKGWKAGKEVRTSPGRRTLGTHTVRPATRLYGNGAMIITAHDVPSTASGE